MALSLRITIPALAALVSMAAAHASDIELSAPATNVPIVLGGYADVPVTIGNRTAHGSYPALVFEVPDSPGYHFETLSSEVCGPVFRNRVTIASIPAGEERTCVFRISRDAAAIDNAHLGLALYPYLGAPLYLDVGSFDDIESSGELLSRTLVDGEVLYTWRLYAFNHGPLTVLPELLIGQCVGARFESDIPGGCELVATNAGCPLQPPLQAAKMPTLAPGESSSCLVAMRQQPDYENTLYSNVFRLTDPSTGGAVTDANPRNDQFGLVMSPRFNPYQYGLSGSWVNSETPSQGFVLDVQPDFYDAGDAFVFGGWFTFGPGPNDGQRWYTVQGTIDTYFVSDSAVLPVYRTDGGRFDSAQPTTTTEVGSLTVHFDDCRHGRLDYALIDGAPLQGSIPITRLLQSVSCQLDGNILSDDRNYHFSGTWADPANSGQGLVLDVDPSQHALFGAWYTFARDAIAQRWYTLQATLTPDATASDNVAIYASSGGVFDQHAPMTTQQVGTASLSLDGCNAATLTYHFTTGDNAGADGVLELARIGDPPPRCVP